MTEYFHQIYQTNAQILNIFRERYHKPNSVIK